MGELYACHVDVNRKCNTELGPAIAIIYRVMAMWDRLSNLFLLTALIVAIDTKQVPKDVAIPT